MYSFINLSFTFSQQGLHRAQELATNAGMKHMVLKAIEQRQAGIVTPVLFECALLDDAGKLFCTLEEGDDVNPVVRETTAQKSHFFIREQYPIDIFTPNGSHS